MKDNFNLYIFTKEILTEELYNLLKELYGFKHSKDYSNVFKLELVPGAEHFIAINNASKWSYRKEIVVTKEQVDKFIQINNVIPMNFIEFIETYKD